MSKLYKKVNIIVLLLIGLILFSALSVVLCERPKTAEASTNEAGAVGVYGDLELCSDGTVIITIRNNYNSETKKIQMYNNTAGRLFFIAYSDMLFPSIDKTIEGYYAYAFNGKNQITGVIGRETNGFSIGYNSIQTGYAITMYTNYANSNQGYEDYDIATPYYDRLYLNDCLFKDGYEIYLTIDNNINDSVEIIDRYITYELTYYDHTYTLYFALNSYATFFETPAGYHLKNVSTNLSLEDGQWYPYDETILSCTVSLDGERVEYYCTIIYEADADTENGEDPPELIDCVIYTSFNIAECDYIEMAIYENESILDNINLLDYTKTNQTANGVIEEDSIVTSDNNIFHIKYLESETMSINDTTYYIGSLSPSVYASGRSNSNIVDALTTAPIELSSGNLRAKYILADVLTYYNYGGNRIYGEYIDCVINIGNNIIENSDYENGQIIIELSNDIFINDYAPNFKFTASDYPGNGGDVENVLKIQNIKLYYTSDPDASVNDLTGLISGVDIPADIIAPSDVEEETTVSPKIENPTTMEYIMVGVFAIGFLILLYFALKLVFNNFR